MGTNDLYLDLLKKCLTASIYEESAWKIVEPITVKKKLNLVNTFRAILLKALARNSLMIVKRKPFNAAVRELGLDWPCFGYTMIGHKRLDNIQLLIEGILKNDIQGDLIECGAWRGGSAIFMRAVLKVHSVTNRIVWVADSFEGMPKPNVDRFPHDKGWDYSHVEHLKVSLQQVKSNFARFGLLDDQVRLLKGWFCYTLPAAPIEKLALLRLDADLYESTMDSLKHLYHRVSPGGYVIIDDYNIWPPCKKAVTDFLCQHGINPEINKIDSHAIYWQTPLRSMTERLTNY